MHSEKTHKQTLTGKWRRRVHAQNPTHIPRRNGHGPNANRVPPTNEILTMYHPRARPQLSQKDALRESSLVAPIRPTDDLLCGPKAYAPVRESFKRELKKSPRSDNRLLIESRIPHRMLPSRLYRIRVHQQAPDETITLVAPPTKETFQWFAPHAQQPDENRWLR